MTVTLDVSVLNAKVEDVREVNINVVGDRKMPMLGEFNERAISVEEVREAVNQIKSAMALGLGVSASTKTLYGNIQ